MVLINPATPAAASRWPKLLFDRTKAAEPRASRSGGPKRLGERRHLDGIAQRRAGAVRLDVVDGVRRDVGRALGHGDHFGLAIHARRREADLGRAVIVDGGAADDRVDRLPVRQRVLESPEHHDADAVAEDGALGVRIERAAVAVGRADATLDVEIAFLLRIGHRDAAGQRGIALPRQERLTGLNDGDE